jgi:hypothetical protein
MLLRLAALAGAGYAGYRAYQARKQGSDQPDQAAPTTGTTAATAPGSEEPNLSPPDPKSAVMPDGADANDAIGARTIGDNG